MSFRKFWIFIVLLPVSAAYADVPSQTYKIVIDPGHGGSDPGTAVAGLVEKDISLRLAKEIEALFAPRIEFEVVLTRSEDYDLSFDARRQLANQYRDGLFLSLHFLSSDGNEGCAPKIYVLEDVPRKEKVIFSRLEAAHTPFTQESWRLASLLTDEFLLESDQASMRIVPPQLAPLIGITKAAVLLEAGCLSQADTDLWKQDDTFKRTAEKIKTAIDRFLARGNNPTP